MENIFTIIATKLLRQRASAREDAAFGVSAMIDLLNATSYPLALLPEKRAKPSNRQRLSS